MTRDDVKEMLSLEGIDAKKGVRFEEFRDLMIQVTEETNAVEEFVITPR